MKLQNKNILKQYDRIRTDRFLIVQLGEITNEGFTYNQWFETFVSENSLEEQYTPHVMNKINIYLLVDLIKDEIKKNDNDINIVNG